MAYSVVAQLAAAKHLKLIV